MERMAAPPPRRPPQGGPSAPSVGASSMPPPPPPSFGMPPPPRRWHPPPPSSSSSLSTAMTSRISTNAAMGPPSARAPRPAVGGLSSAAPRFIPVGRASSSSTARSTNAAMGPPPYARHSSAVISSGHLSAGSSSASSSSSASMGPPPPGFGSRFVSMPPPPPSRQQQHQTRDGSSASSSMGPPRSIAASSFGFGSRLASMPPPPPSRQQQRQARDGLSASSASSMGPPSLSNGLADGLSGGGAKRPISAVVAGSGADVMPPPASRPRIGSASGSSTRSESTVTSASGMLPSAPAGLRPGVRLNGGSIQSVGAATMKAEHRPRNRDPDIITIDDSSDEDEVAETPPMTHVVFCVDASTSMNKRDVQRGPNQKVSRWDAVFVCLNELLEEQLKNSSQSGDGLAVGDVEFSLVRFSDKAQALFQCVKIGDGTTVREKLEEVHKKWPPRGGTGFSAAFEGVKQVASRSKGNVMVVFVSDGRPGDLQAKPPKGNDIQPQYRYHGKNYPSAAVHIREMIEQHGSRLSLQFLCLFKDGKKWCQKLADVFKGTFHMPALRLGQRSTSVALVKPQKRPNPPATDENDVQIVGTKSVETRIRESYEAAKRAGDVVTVQDTTSMRSTFQAFSTTLTTMRTSVRQAAKGPTRERQVVLESRTGQSARVKYEATLMTLHPTKDQFEVPPAEKKSHRIVELSVQPFAQGGLRNVYKMIEKNLLGSLQGPPNRELVAKESRHEVQYKERLRFHVETLRCQVVALELAKKFNAKVRAFNAKPSAERRDTLIPHVSFLEAHVYRLKDDSAPGGFRYLAVEEQLNGDYQKYNDNNGNVLSADATSDAEKSKRRKIKLAQAFSHFTYEETGGKEMVVDIQGVGHKYTDPQLHSIEKKYGRADLGERGINKFFESHQCNVCCKALGLAKIERKSG